MSGGGKFPSMSHHIGIMCVWYYPAKGSMMRVSSRDGMIWSRAYAYAEIRV